MPVIVPVILLALAFVTTPLFVRFLGRNAGWPLSALYVAAAVVEAPAAGADSLCVQPGGLLIQEAP